MALAGVMPAAAAEVTLGRPLMGTVLQVTVSHADSRRARELAEEALAIASHWDDVLTTWRSDGELARLNAATSDAKAPISADLEHALRQMAELHVATAGSFDPAVGRLVRWWAMPPERRAAEPMPGRIPWTRAVAIGDRWATVAPGASIDAGGIGKGIALDAVAAHLRAAGVRSAFLDFGRSSLVAIGAPSEDSNGWAVVVAGLAPGTARGILRLRDRAVSTSQTTAAGDETGAILDPSTGAPVAGPRLATIVGSSAAVTEAWSKAAIIRGRSALGAVTDAELEAFLEDDAGVAVTDGFTRALAAGSVRPEEPARTAPAP